MVLRIEEPLLDGYWREGQRIQYHRIYKAVSEAPENVNGTKLPARCDSILLRAISQRELSKVPGKVIVAPNCAIRRNNDEFLILRPSKSFDRTFVPVNALNQFAGTAIEVYARLGRLRSSERVEL